jgi:hypothetical protein
MTLMTLIDTAPFSRPSLNRHTLERERDWLRYPLMRTRTALRFARVPEVESILREFVAEGEERLAALEREEHETHQD